MRVTMEAGTYDPGSMLAQGRKVGGTGFAVRLPGPGARCAVLRYSVRFSEGFDFVRGGKLPGLAGGIALHYPEVPRGDKGFAARLMWREGGAGEIYVYHAETPRGPGTYGSSIGRGRWHFTPGVWHTLSQVVLLNDAGRRNGRMWMVVDGREVLDSGSLKVADDERVLIDGLIFQVFFGGNDPSWATPRTVHVDFKDFELKTFREAAEGR